MSQVVVDTSLAIKWVLVEADSALAWTLLDSWLDQGYDIIAPSLFVSEVTNVLYKKVRKGLVTLAYATQSLEQIMLTGPALDLSSDPKINLALSRRALELANQLGLPATYDAHYLALAEREGCELWTADERLWNSVKAHVPWVRWLGETRQPSPGRGAP